VYKLYAIKRPEEFCNAEDPFYLAPRTIPATNEHDKWFTKNRVGEKKLGQLLKVMCEEAGLDQNKKLTNHATRKTLVSKLRDNGIAPTDIIQISGHKNMQSVLNYSSLSETKHRQISEILNTSHIKKSKNESIRKNCTSSSVQETLSLQQQATSLLPEATDAPHVRSVDFSNLQSPGNPIETAASNVSVNIDGQSNQNFQSLFAGSTVNIQNFSVYMK